jgi:hypothetical protein
VTERIIVAPSTFILVIFFSDLTRERRGARSRNSFALIRLDQPHQKFPPNGSSPVTLDECPLT